MGPKKLISLLCTCGLLAVATPSSAESVYFKVDTPALGPVNLRTGPGTNYSIIKALPHGTRAQRVQSEGNWYEVALGDDTVGWMYKDFMKLSEIGQTPKPERDAPVFVRETCTDQMTLDQTGDAASYLRDLLSFDIKLALDRCRNLTLTSKQHGAVTGKLHELALELNPAWTKVAYFGLRSERGVFASGNVITAQFSNAAETANWLIAFQGHRSKLLSLAGYEKDPDAVLHQSLAAEFETLLGTPELSAALTAARRMPARGAQAQQISISGSNS